MKQRRSNQVRSCAVIKVIKNKMQKGYVAIVTVLTISLVALVVAVTVSLLAIGEGQASLAYYKGEDTLSFVEGCMEDALLKIKGSPTYAGGSITRPEGTCTITISKVGSTWITTATTTATNYKRTVQTVVTRSGTLTLTSWREF